MQQSGYLHQPKRRSPTGLALVVLAEVQTDHGHFVASLSESPSDDHLLQFRATDQLCIGVAG